MRLPLVVVVVAAAASALDLGQGWRVSLDGDTITARRRGVPGLEALAVTFSVGYLSGGGPTTLPNPIGFTAAKFTADLDAPLGNLTLRATAAGAEASGAFCESRRSAHCEVVSCASVDYWDAAAAPSSCLGGAVALSVDAAGRLSAVASLAPSAAAAPSRAVVGRLALTTASAPDEMLVGFGNQPSKLDLKNSSFDVVSQENGIGRGDEPISALVGAGAAGAAGSPLTQHSDVGGMIFCETAWLCERTDELLARWLELSAVVDPVLRSHPSNGNDRVPQPWSDEANLAATRRAVAIHVALRAYKRALVAAAARGGPPVVRHAYHACATDALPSERFDALGGAQLMLGDDVLVVPVLAAGAKTVNATVPPPCAGPGAWVRVWDPDTPLAPGAAVELPAPLGMPAILARNGTAAAAALVAAAAALGPA